jgi:polyhydroxyalkanoate synthesis regulator phasin
MEKGGSDVVRDKGTRESALVLIDSVIAKRDKLTLQIQHEIVNNGKEVIDTLAGQQLAQDIFKEMAERQKEMAQLQQKMQRAIDDNDAIARAHIAEMKGELQAKILAR